jgi:hypothetical protein
MDRRRIDFELVEKIKTVLVDYEWSYDYPLQKFSDAVGQKNHKNTFLHLHWMELQGLVKKIRKGRLTDGSPRFFYKLKSKF